MGTSFPDIRYLWVVNREFTHFEKLTIGNIRKDKSFLAGIKFHSTLDEVREKFIVNNNTYELCRKSKYFTQSLKILEDIILKKNRIW
jgi:hypothetical protein